ncbi:MAG: ABC transporter ATP-binding protein, partial [Nitrospira sp.]|nr:ABC transporter ATP-binding protein [Nitrospira sp.]
MLGMGGGASFSSPRREEVWPVRDVSFEVQCGDIVGIVGRNGAGKSTLLKLLSRITEPTSGRAHMYGRVGTLLEVGTGFHPELTGRDNIYLSGIIYGMKKQEIDKRFDEIVAFSGVEKYIDTPVKRYSSGMYVRLAFAVGAHMDCEVLIVDEVLAVGDTQFQKKCLNKMHDMGGQGRTVLFVSHNMDAVTRLCKRVILLDQGKVIADGSAHEVVGTYMHAAASKRASKEWTDLSTAPGDDVARLCGVRVKTIEGQIPEIIDIRQTFAIEIEIEVLRPGWVLTPNFELYSDEGACIFESFDWDPTWRRCSRPVGRYVSRAWIPGNLLSEGYHFVTVHCASIDPFRIMIKVEEVVGFRVVDSHEGDSARGDYTGDMIGAVRPMLKWTTQLVSRQESANIKCGEE